MLLSLLSFAFVLEISPIFLVSSLIVPRDNVFAALTPVPQESLLRAHWPQGPGDH